MNYKKAFIIIGVCLVLLMLDAFSKALCYYYISPMAFTSSYPYGGIGVFENFFGISFVITHVANKGAAWGIFSNYEHLLRVTRIAIILGMLGYLWVAKISYIKKFSLSLIATGALANVIDCFVYGHVIDLFYFRFWGYSYPVFNIADSMIFIGILVFLIASRKSKETSSGAN